MLGFDLKPKQSSCGDRRILNRDVLQKNTLPTIGREKLNRKPLTDNSSSVKNVRLRQTATLARRRVLPDLVLGDGDLRRTRTETNLRAVLSAPGLVPVHLRQNGGHDVSVCRRRCGRLLTIITRSEERRVGKESR